MKGGERKALCPFFWLKEVDCSTIHNKEDRTMADIDTRDFGMLISAMELKNLCRMMKVFNNDAGLMLKFLNQKVRYYDIGMINDWLDKEVK